MIIVRCLAWKSAEVASRLLQYEIEELFQSCFQLAQMGALNGKFQNACQVLYWQRLKKEN